MLPYLCRVLGYTYHSTYKSIKSNSHLELTTKNGSTNQNSKRKKRIEGVSLLHHKPHHPHSRPQPHSHPHPHPHTLTLLFRTYYREYTLD
jgi:hypothetical protein